jgi:hypothetical protein
VGGCFYVLLLFTVGSWCMDYLCTRPARLWSKPRKSRAGPSWSCVCGGGWRAVHFVLQNLTF